MAGFLFSAWSSEGGGSGRSSTQSWLVIVQLLSRVRLCDPRDCSVSGFPVHHQLPELAQTYVHQVSDAIQPSHPLSSPSPPTFSLSQNQGLFQWLSSSHQVAKYWSFSFSISPSSEYSGLISFRMDWFGLFAVQRIQHHRLGKWKSILMSLFLYIQMFAVFWG